MIFFKKIIGYIKIFWHSIFYGMSGADSIINGPPTISSGVEVMQQKSAIGGVFADMLEEKQTQQVKETVDAYYRVYLESGKWDTSQIVILSESEDGIVFGGTTNLKKKTVSNFMKHPPVFNPDELNIRTIQDNFILGGNNITTNSLYNYETTLKCYRDEFTPRFQIEKIVKKIVVRKLTEKTVIVDLYLPADASQFGKIDAIVISNLYSMMDSREYKSDLTDFTHFEWVSNKAWNCDDIHLFKYKVHSLVGMNKYDGNIILSYVCNIEKDGENLTLSKKTKELDEKYAIEAPKRDDIDIFTYSRHVERKKEKIDINNLQNQKMTLD